MLDFTPDLIDLWLASVDQVRDPELWPRYRALLSDHEREREARVTSPALRQRLLLTRALVRTVLSRYAPIAPEQWRFVAGTQGKPGVANEGALARRLSFNLSHTRGLILLGVTRDAALGVDVECLRPRAAAQSAGQAVFAPHEAADLARLDPQARERRFYQVWTLKESYLKARGVGQAIALDSFGFDLSQRERPRLQAPPDDQTGAWRFWQFQAGPQHLAALCAQRLGGSRPRLELRHVVPLQSESRASDIAPLTGS